MASKRKKTDKKMKEVVLEEKKQKVKVETATSLLNPH